MWIIVLLMVLAQPVSVSFAQSPEASLTVVGEFSNMQFTEEHAYGNSVQLWHHGDKLFGFFEASEGLAGDTPAGLLDEVHS